MSRHPIGPPHAVIVGALLGLLVWGVIALGVVGGVWLIVDMIGWAVTVALAAAVVTLVVLVVRERRRRDDE